MKKVTIRECPTWGGTRELAARVADALRKEPGVEVEVVNGNRGEFTVLVDGRVIAQKGLDFQAVRRHRCESRSRGHASRSQKLNVRASNRRIAATT